MGIDVYRFTADSTHHDVAIETFEAKIVYGLGRFLFPPWRAGLFAAHRIGDVQKIPRETLLSDGRSLLTEVERYGPQLQFNYSLRVSTQALRSYVDRSVDCIFAGRRATVISGPGVCAVLSRDELFVDAARAAVLVAQGLMRPGEADSFRDHPGQVVLAARLKDLRDMAPIVSDNGVRLRAARRPRPTKFADLVRGVVRFIEDSASPTIDVSLVRAALA